MLRLWVILLRNSDLKDVTKNCNSPKNILVHNHHFPCLRFDSFMILKVQNKNPKKFLKFHIFLDYC